MTTYRHNLICPKCKTEAAFRTDEPFDHTSTYTMGCDCGGINEFTYVDSEVLEA